MKKAAVAIWILFCLLICGCGVEPLPMFGTGEQTENTNPGTSPPHTVIAEDPTRTVSLLTLTPLENSRTQYKVNLSLYYKIKNVGTTRKNFSLSFVGKNSYGNEVFTWPFAFAIDPGTSTATLSLGEVLSPADFDSITTWTARGLTVSQ